MILSPAAPLPPRPRVLLSHRIIARLLEMVGIVVPLPEPDAGRREGRARWHDLGDGRVELVEAAGQSGLREVAVVVFDHPSRPRSAVVTIHTLLLARNAATQEQRDLEADVQIGAGLVADIFGGEVAP